VTSARAAGYRISGCFMTRCRDYFVIRDQFKVSFQKKPINSGFALADRFIGVPGNSSTIQTYESMAESQHQNSELFG
jgi:hypothetical protein